MEQIKRKRGSGFFARRLPFALLWALSGLMLGLLSDAFIATDPMNYLTIQQLNILLTLWTGATGWLVQILLVQHFLKRSMRGWLVYNLIASGISIFLSNAIMTSLTPDIDFNLLRALMAVVSLTPSLVLQTLWFWRRVHKPWLWPVIMVALSIGFNIFYASSGPVAEPFAWVLSLFAGLISGGLMHYLLTDSQTAEKAKIDLATDADEERLQRLQEQEDSTPSWDLDDSPPLHSKAQ